MKKNAAVFLLLLQTAARAQSWSSSQLSINSTAMSTLQSAAQTVANAAISASVILGLNPSNPFNPAAMTIVLPIYLASSLSSATGEVAVPLAPVAPQTPMSATGTDEFGNRGIGVANPNVNCSVIEAELYNAGPDQCGFPGQSNAPQYQTYTGCGTLPIASCQLVYTPMNASCGGTSASDAYASVANCCECLQSGETPSSNATPASYQPYAPPTAAIAQTNQIAGNIGAALNVMNSQPSANMGSQSNSSTVALLVAAQNYLQKGVALSASQVSNANPSPTNPNTSYCSTCAVASPSTGATSNVWINNPELHVIVDNTGSFSTGTVVSGTQTITVNISTASFSIGDGTVLSVSTVSVWTSTLTLASVYNDFVTSRSSSPLFNMLNGFSNVFTVTSTATFSTNFCIPTVEWGTHCYDINTGGYWDTLVSMLYWGIQAAALISGYFIIYS